MNLLHIVGDVLSAVCTYPIGNNFNTTKILSIQRPEALYLTKLYAKMKTRCKTGCLTCRRRRKKCDESSYPLCKNCQTNLLKCTWPESVIELNKKKFAGFTNFAENSFKPHPTSGISEKEAVSSPASGGSTPQNPNLDTLRHESDLNAGNTSTSKSRPHNISKNRCSSYFLQKIAMQEDCVDDDAPLQHTPKSDIKSSIRSRIWNQLDVIDDVEFISSKSYVDMLSERGSPSPVNT